MFSENIARQRLYNQHIACTIDGTPADIVRQMGFVQAQDYLGALWAVGLRVPRATQADIEQALADRSIVRTWPARGTLHFVAAEDVRWILELLTPRMVARSAGRHRQLDLDQATFTRSGELFVQALQGGKQLPRDAMYQVLEAGHISTAGQRGIHILGRLAQEGLLCFGARDGKQQTFALLAEWVPHSKTLERDQALAELTRRYFKSHGPATLQDFVWWSGLTTSDARAGLEMAKPHLVQEVINGQAGWLSPSMPPAKETSPSAYLLPAFDEYLIAYKDRSAVLDATYVKQTNAGGGMLSPTIVIDGQVAGTWKRTLKKGSVVIQPAWFTQPTNDQQAAFSKAAHQYGAFLGLPVVLA